MTSAASLFTTAILAAPSHAAGGCAIINGIYACYDTIYEYTGNIGGNVIVDADDTSAVYVTVHDLTSNIVTPFTGLSGISLTGTGEAGDDGDDGQYYCSIAGDCVIDTLNDTCTVTSQGQTDGATCEETIVISGEKGESGPDLTLTYSSTGKTVYVLGGTKDSPTAGIYVVSTGSKGSKGGDSHFAGNAHDGGDGADGGTVLVSSTGDIVTWGNYAAGFYAASIGGKGGKGGSVKGIEGEGGDGGAGGMGGAVYVYLNGGTITTQGNYSPGIVASSQGGEGGEGGGGVGIFYFKSGSGSTAGCGNLVYVRTEEGTVIQTSGDYSYGIFAQSIGGTGGSGGGGGGVYADGSDGGSGGDGGEVIVSANGSIFTTGDYAIGILAQSIGGGGGNASTVGGAYAAGGSGEVGGNGSDVTVDNTGTIVTTGYFSSAIEAQSIGGGGGNGASSGGLVSLGGSGSVASDAGEVVVDNSGALTTSGDLANGILAQSIGGGGGNGASSAGLFYAGGGDGGAGGDADTVTVTNSGEIVTSGLGANAIVAQSIGGGGGNGGGAVSAGVVSVGVGGAGGDGGDAGDVVIDNSASLITSGDNASGILAQSIGGGGGNGGFAAAATTGTLSASVTVGGSGGSGGDAGDVTVVSSGVISTEGNSSAGIVAQSIGGGGGNGGLAASGSFSTVSVNVAIGGSGGDGGDAGDVDVTVSDLVVTTGDNSSAIVAQSIGGGGGNGGFSATASLANVMSFNLSLGGSGGSGGDAGSVLVTVLAGSDTVSVDGLDGTWNLATSGANSSAIVAQSIGGGGGNGGLSGSLTFNLGTALGVSLGGDGGSGGDAGSVTVYNGTADAVNNIVTLGDLSDGILAQSIGGSGGNGGLAVTLSGAVLSGSSAAVSLGGDGANGGAADDVTVVSYGDILTAGDESNAIVVQSIGGSGGNGGWAISGSLSYLGSSLALAIGGDAGAGSEGGDVVLSSTGDLTTYGEQANAIVAQSIGGGGGNGGLAGSASISTGTGVAIAIGGTGGLGGDAGSVTVTSIGDIATYGTDSVAILAQSIGGGGGNGGTSIDLALGTSGIGVSIGRSGGDGGDGDDVVVTSTGNISTGTADTDGNNAVGILAQSIGGGGGNGGISGTVSAGVVLGLGVSLGGDGGIGGDAGTVSVTNLGNISTLYDNSSAIIAQSVGGGGGNGGFAVALTVSAAIEDLGAAGAVSIGGSGGTGGTGDDVTVVSTGQISTTGDFSDGILAQSVGGGGGNGGFAVTGTASLGNASLSVAVGGSGNDGGDAGDVVVVSHGYSDGSLLATYASVATIATEGDYSSAIFAQSVGGGGGNGGFVITGSLAADGGALSLSVGGSSGEGGDAGSVDVTSYNNILTTGDYSFGVLAQSIGGGGGNGGFALSLSGGSDLAASVSVGGWGNDGGDADAVTLTSIGNVQTEGDGSVALLAQSVGGGGGNGGFALSGSVTSGSAAISASLGGFGGAGGDAGNVTLTNIGDISTSGSAADAIFAQSVGGGGGSGGLAGSLSLSGDGVTLGVSLGGWGDDGGDGDDVVVISTGDVVTQGSDSSAIFAQSVGGGGGDGGLALTGTASASSVAISGSLGGTGGTGGDAGKVTVTSTGTLSTSGDESSAIVAQSVGGGGGNGGFSGSIALSGDSTSIGLSIGGYSGEGGDADDVLVTQVGDIETTGTGSKGIYAQSIGGGGGNGGSSLTFAGAQNGAVSLSVGGWGNDGGDAGSVRVDFTGMILTSGDLADAIFAQSVGGGGGDGGLAISGSLSMDSAGVAVSIGGTGGSGGDADSVTVNSNVGSDTGVIYTLGDSSNGIYAQSVGGGGGTGGLAGSVTLGLENSAINVALAIGGFGGDGGDAGAVVVTSNDNIYTAGIGSNGIFAQSVGGGGGDGGYALAAVLTETEEAVSLTVSMGGTGGTGGDGNDVTVTSTGTIYTTGDESNGVVAQSVGGGGGNGGFSASGIIGASSETVNLSVSLGGWGGTGGVAGDVAVTRTGDIVTEGDSSNGIFAQSVGGGGGSGGIAFSGVIAGTDAKSISAVIGGFGGTGGDAGDVVVDNTGNISTSGSGSSGIYAQSVGGGGGNGGAAISAVLGSNGEGTNLNVGVTVGGWGGDSGVGGDVSVISNGIITTTGDSSYGIFAQSVGGGGGSGGASVNGLIGLYGNNPGRTVNVDISVGGEGGDGAIGGTVYVEQSGGIYTTGDGSIGIYAQSIGGGGGQGGSANSISLQLGAQCTIPIVCETGGKADVNLQVAVGGSGGTGNDGGTVTVINHDYIVTTGDSANGIKAQSIGGGGGSGGNAAIGLSDLVPDWLSTAAGLGLAVIGTSSFTASGSVTVGGFGGASGDGNTVTVTNEGLIATSGTDSDAIYAQSVGGGGGSGGDATSGLLGTISVGGFGGAAGDGGEVIVVNTDTAQIQTTGDNSDGIFAQSVGGGGGNGGGSAGIVAVGGFGSAAGDGGTVSVTNAGSIYTTGDSSRGIYAQSIGGGGGDGGAAILTAIAVGGFGGASGDGGDVIIDNSGTIETEGLASSAIYAQSVGGGGGTIEGQDAANGGEAVSLISVGGYGGAAGDGGTVTVTNSGILYTTGDQSNGIFAQSVGGGGGDGGTAIGVLSLGGGAFSGGSASGDGGSVIIANIGQIATFGEFSNGIFAQSVGGGGGTFDGSLTSETDLSAGLVTVGGTSASAGDGGLVSVTNSALIYTAGNSSNGIYAQSIGGGGGNAGMSIGFVTVGGDGGSSGDGGEVDVDNSGAIVTLGESSTAILAQSIGGGGGNASTVYGTGLAVYLSPSVMVGGDGASGGDGGLISVENSGSILTYGNLSNGIVAQSIGGGGGNGSVIYTDIAEATSTFVITVGGDGGAGGDGGDVDIVNSQSGSIVLYGDDVTAILAQSVGGGGGNSSTYASLIGLDSAAEVSVSVGGSGGASGDGGVVSVTNAGSIVLSGVVSYGIKAQSVGGGGGTVTLPTSESAISLMYGGQDGTSGSGGAVSVTNSGSITDSGDYSVGIFAQSVGGGGGLVDGGSDVVVSLSSDNSGNGGTVGVVNSGDITMTGKYSVALFAQSVGGGGGVVGLGDGETGSIGAFSFSGTAGGGGTAADVTVETSGDVIATGVGSVALMAQSSAVDGVGNISVTVAAGALVEGGSGTGRAIALLDGADNVIDNYGTITTVSGVAGMAITGGSGNEAVTNYSLLIGSVNLGGGINTLYNAYGATFNSGTTVYLGTTSADLLTNAGTISPGGLNTVATTSVTGDFDQTTTGTYALDLDFNGDVADRINVSGDAHLSGTVAVTLNNKAKVMPGEHVVTIFHSGGDIDVDGVVLEVAPSAVATYALTYPSDDEVDLDYVIDFSPNGLNRNHTWFGDHINDLQLHGGSDETAPLVVALFDQPDLKSYRVALNELSPQVLSEISIGAEFSVLRFNRDVSNCEGTGGGHSLLSGGRCVWFDASFNSRSTSQSFEYLAAHESGVRLAGGVSVPLAGDWLVNVAMAWEPNHIRMQNGDIGKNGNRTMAGVSVQTNVYDVDVAFGISTGRLSSTITRNVAFDGFSGSAKGTLKGDFVSFHAAAAYEQRFDGWYVKPLLEADLTLQWVDQYKESGTASMVLTIPKQQNIYETLRPSVETGFSFDAFGLDVRPNLRLGMIVALNDGAPFVASRLTNVPDDVGSYYVSGSLPSLMFDGALSLDIAMPFGADLKLSGTWQSSGQTQMSGGWMKLTVPF